MCEIDDTRCTRTDRWQGSWSSFYYTDSGRLDMTITMDAFSFSGPVSISGSPCFARGNVSGDIFGSDVTSGAVFEGGQRVEFVGEFKGNCMDGVYGVRSGQCAGDVGSYRVCR